MELLQILIKSAIVDNVVFIQYLAICPFIGMTAETDKAFGMGVATSFVIILATAVTWPIYKFIMIPLGLEFLQTLFFILIIASLVQLVEFFLKKSIPALYKSMGPVRTDRHHAAVTAAVIDPESGLIQGKIHIKPCISRGASS